MAVGNIGNYASSYGAPEIIGGNGEKWLLIFNDTGAAITNGTAYVIKYTNDTINTAYFPGVATPATLAGQISLVGIVDNSILGQSTIAAAAWGYVQVKGFCNSALTAVTTADYLLRVINAGTTLVVESSPTTVTTSTVGIYKGVGTGNTSGTSGQVYLYGNPVVIAAS